MRKMMMTSRRMMATRHPIKTGVFASSGGAFVDGAAAGVRGGKSTSDKRPRVDRRSLENIRAVRWKVCATYVLQPVVSGVVVLMLSSSPKVEVTTPVISVGRIVSSADQ